MSKRAEEASFAAIPTHPNKDLEHLRKGQRRLFVMGYEQAEKDTIERAIKWLKENWREYVWITDNDIPHFGHWENDFRKALEEE